MMTMSDLYVPKNAKIPDKICVVYAGWDNKPNLSQKEPIRVSFSSKVDNSPTKTITIVDNLFVGESTISKIWQPNNSDFYALLTIKDVLPSNNINPKLSIDIRHWALNEIFMAGIIKKGGKIKSGVKFVAVTYGGYSTMIIKGGPLYNKILDI